MIVVFFYSLHVPVQSESSNTKIMNSVRFPPHGKVYSIQFYVINFISETGASNESGIAYPHGAPEFTPGF